MINKIFNLIILGAILLFAVFSVMFAIGYFYAEGVIY